MSATLGFAAVLLLSLLAWRISNSRPVVLFVALTAFFTPWLYEISRLVFEVALFPLVLTIFLLFLHCAYAKEKWTLVNCFAVAFSLALVTYAYSIGRLLAPLLALGLVLFVNHKVWNRIALTWIFYGCALIPLLVYSNQNPGALTNRFDFVSYITKDSAPTEILWQFIFHYANNFNLWFLFLKGDPNPRHHLPGLGNIFLPTLILAVIGIILAVRRSWRSAWWRYVLYGLAVSVVPASLTNHDFHSLRLIALPVFLIVLMVPALLYLIRQAQAQRLRQFVLIALIGGTLVQAVFFQWQFAREGRNRTTDFEADYPQVINFALKNSQDRIYLIDDSYVHAYWYGTLEKSDLSRLSVERENLSVNSVLVGYKTSLHDCQTIMEGEKFAVCTKR